LEVKIQVLLAVKQAFNDSNNNTLERAIKGKIANLIRTSNRQQQQ
jgi:hypothetical protein